MVGGEYFNWHQYTLNAKTQNSPSDDIPTLNAGSNRTYSYSYKQGYRILSGFARVNYNYNLKYLLSVVARYDGISKLSDHRWGFFPGVSVGWNVTEEDFWKESKISEVISNIKPRLSYGVNGNVNGNPLYKTKNKTKSIGEDNSGELFPPDLPPTKKPVKPKVEFIPPTAEEVREYFRDKLPDWELQADIFYNHFSGLGWKTATGAKVERWDSRANLWIIEKKQQDNGKTENQAQRQNSRDADKTAKARNLLDEYAAIEQGSNAISHQGEIPDL